MMRGTFANIRIRNRMLNDVEGGFTRYAPTGETLPIYDAAMAYAQDGTPLVVIAGKEYGTGSSRDWAAKGTMLLGVRAVIAESFERIHRSNLVGMGVLPLQFREDENAEGLGLDGSETFSISGVADIQPRQDVEVQVTKADGIDEQLHRALPHRHLQRARIFPAPAESSIMCCGGSRPVSALVGTCHCGRVRITLPRKPDEVTQCNCSLCTKTGFQGIYYASDELRSRASLTAMSAPIRTRPTSPSNAAAIAGSLPTGRR